MNPTTMENMTEDEWSHCAEPYSMLNALQTSPMWDEAKVRLFACWCARQGWELLVDDRSRRAVEVAEQFANGSASFEELEAAEAAAMKADEDVEASSWDDMVSPAQRTAKCEATYAATSTATTTSPEWTDETPAGTAARCAASFAASAAAALSESDLAGTAIEQAQANKLREMFNNPLAGH